jgi:hypothetical protein
MELSKDMENSAGFFKTPIPSSAFSLGSRLAAKSDIQSMETVLPPPAQNG